MIVKEQDQIIILEKMAHFNLENTFENGQCFRWNRVSESHYAGVAHGRLLNVKRVGDDIQMYPLERDEFEDTWKSYFDLDRDYSRICRELNGLDPYLDQALLFSEGIRLLNQDPWETTISFIISANNNILRIKKIVEKLSEEYGTWIGGPYYAFPSAEQLSQATIEELRNCGLGYRDRYIHGVAKAVASKEFDFKALESMDVEAVEKQLVKLDGVGLKVAQCIMLFSLGIEEVVPADTWIKKIVALLYSEEISADQSIGHFFQSKFGQNSGYAQQVLFHWARSNQLGR